MKLPIEISPSPLIQSAVEIRFSSELKKEDLLGAFYPHFSEQFPKFKENSIPKELRLTQQFEFAADFIFSNDNFSIGVGTKSIVFDNVNGYHLWNNYFSVIKKNLAVLNNINVVKKINRIGVRYINVFSGKSDINSLLNFHSGLNFDGYNGQAQMANILLTKENITLVVQLASKAIVISASNLKSSNGLYIDIDSSSSMFSGTVFNEEVFNTIDFLHTEEKKLFYSLLKEDFLKTLNPIY